MKVKAEVRYLPGGQIVALRIGLLVSLLMIISGCSSRGWFNWGKQVGESKADCAALVSVSERRKCEESFDLDYERYEKARASIQTDASRDR